MPQKRRKRPDVGEQAELVVVEVLEKFITERQLFKHRIKLVKVIHSRKSEQYDSEGIDVLLIFNTGLSLPLQIKKSAARDFRRHLSKHPAIIWMSAVGELPKGKSDATAYDRIARNLESLINKALAYHCKNGSL